jgi:TPR repeat protein
MRMLRPLVASSLLFACLLAQAAPDTAYNLGVDAYRVKDYTSARQHWAKAVEEGENFALNNLGFLLYEGLGGPPDQARAVELWSMAARRGNNESQWHLAQAFEKGKGVAQSLVDAYAWYRCAANNFAGSAPCRPTSWRPPSNWRGTTSRSTRRSPRPEAPVALALGIGSIFYALGFHT